MREWLFPPDMRQPGFLAKEETDGWDAMLERDAMDGDAAVFEDKLMLTCVNRMEDDFVANLSIVDVLQEVEQFAHLLRSVDVQFGSPSQQVHGTNQARQSEDVVSVIVADEDVSDVCHRKPHHLHLCLCSFATVYHEVFAPHVKYLRGWLVVCRWLCRATTEYIQFEVHKQVTSKIKIHNS